MILFILACIATLIALCIFIAADRKSTAIIPLVLAIVLFVMSFACPIAAGHTGIVTSFGKVQEETLDAGLNFKAPWKKVVKMDNRIQKETIELSCFSADIQEVSMKYTVNYQLTAENTKEVYKTIGKNYFEKSLLPVVAESVKTVAGRYNAEQMISNRNEMAREMEEEIAANLSVYKITVSTTSVEDIDFTDSFTNAVEAKQVAQQNRLKAETEAEQKVIEAEAAADIQKIKADAYAYEMMTKAEAEAEANRKVAASLTDSLIDYTYAQNWNGQYPTYYGGDGIVPVINGIE